MEAGVYFWDGFGGVSAAGVSWVLELYRVPGWQRREAAMKIGAYLEAAAADRERKQSQQGSG